MQQHQEQPDQRLPDKPGPAVKAPDVKADELDGDWGLALESFEGLLKDDSQEAEEERVKIIKNVFTFELMKNNPQFARFGPQPDVNDFKPPQRSPPSGPFASLKSGWYKWVDWRWRWRAYVTFEHPNSSALAWAVCSVVMLAVLINAVTFCLETIPSIERNEEVYHNLEIVDYVCMGIFTVDFLVRIICCPNLLKFCTSFMNIIDFVAIAPFYIELIILAADPDGSTSISQTRILRLFRILRLVRMLRLFPRFQNMMVVVDALAASVDVLVMLGFMLLIILVVFGTVIYYVDKTSDSTPFDSIPLTMYYVQTTLTTTGYGDIVPYTYPGKAVAGLLMLFAIMTLALPISVIGANFTTMWMDFRALQQAAKRANDVWPNFKELVQSLTSHQAALTDIMNHFKAIQAQVEADVAGLRELAQATRVLYQQRAAKGASEEWQEDVQELRECVAEMRERLAAVRHKWEELEALISISAYVRSDDFLLRLDRLHLAFKNLRKWFEEGVLVIKEVKMLTKDIDALKASFQAVPSLAGATSAAAGPAA